MVQLSDLIYTGGSGGAGRQSSEAGAAAAPAKSGAGGNAGPAGPAPATPTKPATPAAPAKPGAPAVVPPLPLRDLLAAIEYAMIGAAATESGLALPTRERLAEIRAAGVEANAAIQGYKQFGLNQGTISASVQRAGYDEFTQDEFERGQFLGNAELSRQLYQGLAAEEAAGRNAGEFRFAEDAGRLVQRGFDVRR
jgi:hypothetical protein